MQKVAFLANVSAWALVAWAPSVAQAQDSSAAAARAAAESPQDLGVQDIIVTAERREQSVQKSSLAITVHGAADLANAGVSQTRDFTKLDPGVQIGQGGPAAQVYVRGVGDVGSTPITNPAVAVNIDGVYVSRANSLEGNFFDLQRVEVLKGPQGTLYGRNASGGAINVITNPPRLEEFAGNIEAEVGNYSLLRSSGYLNIPVGETLAVRASYQVVSRDGYSSQGFDDDKQRAVRLSALWKPDDRLSLRLTGDYHHIDGVGPGYVFKDLAAPVAAFGQARGITIPTERRLSMTDPRTNGVFNAAIAFAGLCIPNGFIPAASATKTGTLTAPQGLCNAGFGALIVPPDAKFAGQSNHHADFTAQLDYEFDWAKLTVIPAYRYVENRYRTFPILTYSSYAPDKPETSDTYSLEARLGNTSSRLTWVAGIYLYKEDQAGSTDLGTGNAPFGVITGVTRQDLALTTKSWAGFGQMTYSLTDQWRVIGGLRYSSDHKEISGQTTVRDDFLSLPYAAGRICFNQASPCTNLVFAGKKSWDSVTYKIGTEYDVTPDNMLFVTYATGQKSGGFNQNTRGGYPLDLAAIPYNPEKLSALEIGSRNRFFDNRVQLNLEGFYWKYKDSHQTFVFINVNGPANGTTNAGSATIYGLDASLDVRITSADTLSLSGEYLHSNFDQFTFSSSGLTPLTTGCDISTGAGGLQNIDCSGKPLTRAPKWSGTAQFTHVFDLASGATIDAMLSGQFASSRFLTTDFTPSVKAKAYGVGDFQLTYRSPDKKWSLSGYVRNITDAKVYTGAFAVAQFWPGLTVANLAAPRTFGGRLSVDF